MLEIKEKTDVLFELERWFDDENLVKHQVGFCVQYCLDNLFIYEQRKFSYERADNSKLNAILNVNDSCEYLKIAADGLHARCDASLFESIRSTYEITEGESLSSSVNDQLFGQLTNRSKHLFSLQASGSTRRPS